MKQLITIDTAKRASTKRIAAVTPFHPYSRQDERYQGREPISARLIADLYKTAGTDRVISADLHASQEQGFFDGSVDHLFVMPVFMGYVHSRIDLPNAVMISPDMGRIRVAEKWSPKPGNCPLTFVHKTRDTTRPNVAVASRVVSGVKGKDCVLVGGMIDMMGTTIEAAKVLTKVGAGKIIIVATHGTLSAPAVSRLSECGTDKVAVTDTLSIPADKRLPTLTILPIVSLLARAIHKVFDDESATSLSD